MSSPDKSDMTTDDPHPRRAARAARRARFRTRTALLLLTALLGLTLDLPATAPVRATAVSRTVVQEKNVVRTVVGLGDSVPAGSACDCDPYVSLVGDALATRQGTDVATENLAAAGLTTRGLLDQLDDDTTRRTLLAADLTIITIGANDFDSDTVTDDACGPGNDLACYHDDLVRLRANMDAILARVRALRPRRGTRVLVTGYWNVFMDGAMARAEGTAYVTNSDSLTRAVNATLAASANAAGARYVDLYTPFKNGGDDTALLAEDGDHPAATGHRLIAHEVLSAIFR
ncbi:SGNH/GDSL hydrolase family protein [Streptosporangium saharense]|uniref:SGNH/GDSL hydrolase family protein n=1 Tax=Streptosporangium saharense TaxID=1706840 RepID=UPI00369F8EA9